ncbi:MAG: hypothetical protein ACUVWW_11585, partial [Anaerolineae bacterium]
PVKMLSTEFRNGVLATDLGNGLHGFGVAAGEVNEWGRIGRSGARRRGPLIGTRLRAFDDSLG